MNRNLAKKFFITTFGCQMNEHDSENLAGLLLERGYEEAKERKDADIVIFNTCSIRENADKRFFGTLGQLKKKKEEEGENFTVCVCGCMMQQKHIQDTLKQKYPWVDVVFGTHNLENLPDLLDKHFNEKVKVKEIFEDRTNIPEILPCERMFNHKSFVNITYGCNNFCTYCIVPYTRGREKSRPQSEIINEIKKLALTGVKEVMLLGQNVNSYKGEDGLSFAGLIKLINEIDGIERIRFMTSHPKDLSDELIDCFRTCNKLCHYFHLPVQAGNNKVLKEMNRRYTREHYLELVKKLRAVDPDMAISTDIIVGFPGETEEEFQDTLSLCSEVEYDSAFTFLYSIRKGTPAATYENQIPDDIKHERFDRLVEIINSTSLKKNAEYVGRTVKVLVDGPSRKNSKTFEGRTDTFKLVSFIGKPEMIGNIIDVKITSSNTFSLEGEAI